MLDMFLKIHVPTHITNVLDFHFIFISIINYSIMFFLIINLLESIYLLNTCIDLNYM